MVCHVARRGKRGPAIGAARTPGVSARPYSMRPSQGELAVA